VGLARFPDAPATELPTRAQKLVEICRALMAAPHLLLLDEPAAGLNDAETAELADLLGAVRDGGITVLIVEHNMSLAMASADRIIVLDLGRRIAGGHARRGAPRSARDRGLSRSGCRMTLQIEDVMSRPATAPARSCMACH
jgi:branched-chain amino acid transport system ATP-binding protein